MENFDYGIIGGGPAGYTAGMLLAKSGKSVVLFEKNQLGGTCLNMGCIPTKTFLHYSDLYKQAKFFDENLVMDFVKIVDKKNETVSKIRKSLELAVKSSGVKVVYSEARVIEKHVILADTEYNVGKIIVATGSEPREIKGLEFDGNFIINSDDILNISNLPKSILIIGSGAIGIEWARIMSNFGVEVTISEMAAHLLPCADIEVSKRVERIFKQNKIKILLDDYVVSVKDNTAIFNSGVEIKPEKILVAVGRKPKNAYKEFDNLLGDVCGEIQLAHYAIHQAKEMVTGIPFRKDLVPSIIYGEPEIAWVGCREQDVDDSYTKLMLPVTALGKSWCDNCTDGFIKLIVKDNLIYGAHIISKEASSLIHFLLEAIQNKVSIADLKSMCYAHPTYVEGIFDILMKL